MDFSSLGKYEIIVSKNASLPVMKSEVLSGQDMSDGLKISRVAVLKDNK